MKFICVLINALLLLILFSCKQSSSKDSASTLVKPDFVFNNLDTTTSPAKDFFQYANGNWIKNNPIPPDQSSWGIGDLVIEENIKRLRQISEAAAKKNSSSPGTPDQLIGDFWSSGMDSAKIEADGFKYLKPYLDKINAINDLPSLMKLVTELKMIGSSTFFTDFVNQDDKKVLSSFKMHKKLDVPMIRDQKEWLGRLNLLKETINKHLITIPEKEITYEYLFYDCN